MSPTMHKLLVHGCDIARQLPLPVAYYAEDANESWHKLYRQNMVSHARQNSRKNRLIDTFNRAVCLSDPLISLILIKSRKQFKNEETLTSNIQEFIENE